MEGAIRRHLPNATVFTHLELALEDLWVKRRSSGPGRARPIDVLVVPRPRVVERVDVGEGLGPHDLGRSIPEVLDWLDRHLGPVEVDCSPSCDQRPATPLAGAQDSSDPGRGG